MIITSITGSCNEFIYLTGAQKNAYSLLTLISFGDILDLAPSIYIFNYSVSLSVPLAYIFRSISY